VGAIVERFGERTAGLRETLAELLDRELASVAAVEGALSVVPFLRRRGMKLGVLTNSGSPYREPLARLGLEESFDSVLFSCDAGARKPAEILYRRSAAELGVGPSEALMIGDSLANDVRGPERVGMRGLLVGSSTAAAAVPRLADVGWIDLDAWAPLLPLGTPVALEGREYRVEALEPLADAEQGRYNLVARARLVDRLGRTRVAYAKRFLLPESIEVERFMARLVDAVHVGACPNARIDAGGEPILIVAEAPGVKLEGSSGEPRYAREVGRHAAIAYLFANADLRPRNAFTSGAGADLTMTMVDYEHCLLNLAIDLDGVTDPLDRDALERLGRAELERRVARRVLADAHMRRAYRAFLGPHAKDPALAASFRKGWLEVHGKTRVLRDDVVALLEERLAADPPLVVGTQAYRRAFLRLDLEDVVARIDEDPDRACDRCF
jgi:HAD superfamily hydrolase (TIGR01549 family)